MSHEFGKHIQALLELEGSAATGTPPPGGPALPEAAVAQPCSPSGASRSGTPTAHFSHQPQQPQPFAHPRAPPLHPGTHTHAHAPQMLGSGSEHMASVQYPARPRSAMTAHEAAALAATGDAPHGHLNTTSYRPTNVEAQARHTHGAASMASVPSRYRGVSRTPHGWEAHILKDGRCAAGATHTLSNSLQCSSHCAWTQTHRNCVISTARSIHATHTKALPSAPSLRAADAHPTFHLM